MVKIFLLLSLISLSVGSKFSVSGISSGAFMAVQMHVAYSGSVEGAGIIAGGPFYCAENSESTALTSCMSTPWLLNLRHCEQYTKDKSSSGEIDPTSNLSDTKAWVYSGLLDTVVKQKVGKDLVKFYEAFGVQTSSRFDIPSEHAWITSSYGNACYDLGSPYMNHCGFDAAGTILKTIYGEDLVSKPKLSANLKTFDQSSFADSAADMASQGYIYVPTACQSTSTSCKVHVSYHGCKMGDEYIQNTFAMNSGLNEWAEGSNIIVIYPQVKKNLVKNPNGCWDWWGYTNKYYSVKSGLQMEATYKMAQTPPTGSNLINN